MAHAVAAGFAISTAPADDQEPAIATGVSGDERFGIVYGRFVAEPPYGANRVFLRTSSK